MPNVSFPRSKIDNIVVSVDVIIDFSYINFIICSTKINNFITGTGEL